MRPEAIVEDPAANAGAAAGLAALAAPLPCGQHIPQFDGEGDDEPEARPAVAAGSPAAPATSAAATPVTPVAPAARLG